MVFDTIFRYFFFFVSILTIIGSCIIVTVLQGILYLTVRTFSKTLYRKINYYICYAHYSQMIFVAEWYGGSETYIYVDKNDLKNYLGKEHAFLIVNHSTDIEWLFTLIVSHRVGCAGNFRAYIKKQILYLPAIGWCLFLSETVFLARSFDKDREIIDKQISELVDYPYPMWLSLYPEGTRFTPKKHEISVKYARENGLPEFKHHLTPRVNGFLTSLPAMRGKMGAIYDITIVFKSNAQIKPTIVSVLFGRKLEIHIYIKRIPFEAVPEGEKEASNFLYEMFEKKDKLKDSFMNTGDFFTTSGVKREEPVKLKPSYSVFICTMFWYCVVMLPTLYYILQFLFTATLTSIIFVFGMCSALFVLLYAVVTVIWNGSSYEIVKKTKKFYKTVIY